MLKDSSPHRFSNEIRIGYISIFLFFGTTQIGFRWIQIIPTGRLWEAVGSQSQDCLTTGH